MMRNAILGYMVMATATTACTGSLDSGDPPPPPPATDVQIVVRDGYAPQAGLRVTFQGAQNELIAEAVTDANGLASAEMPAGGMVTVVRTYPQPPPDDNGNQQVIPAEAYTYLGVKAGDRLVLGKPAAEDGVPSAIIIEVPKNAGNVKITSPCGSGQGQAPYIPIAIMGCPSEATFYVTDGQGASFVKKAPVVENVDFTAELFKDSLSSTVSASNVPAGATVSIEKRVEADGYTLWSSGEKRVDTQAQTVDMPTLASVDDVTLTTTSLDGHTQMVATRATYAVGPTLVDVTANRIASVDQPKFDDTLIQWTEDTGAAADLVIARYRVTRTTGTPQTPGPNLEFERILVAPHTGTLIYQPKIEGGDAMYNPILNDQVAGTLGIMKVTGGYDAVRARAFAVENIVDAVPMNATATLSYTGQAPTLGDR